MFPKVTFVIGGAASGKSECAEQLVYKSGQEMIYLATGQARDDEMRQKIHKHVDRRGDDWSLIEEPIDLIGVLSKCDAGQIVLLDCATMWLSNLFEANSDIESQVIALCDALPNLPPKVIIVTNELGMGVVPDHPLSRRFREAHGRMNQKLAAVSNLAVMVVAGLPSVLKGQMP